MVLINIYGSRAEGLFSIPPSLPVVDALRNIHRTSLLVSDCVIQTHHDSAIAVKNKEIKTVLCHEIGHR